MFDEFEIKNGSTWEQELVAFSFLYNIKLERKHFSIDFYARYLKLLQILENLPLSWSASICKSSLKINDSDPLPELTPLLKAN